MVLHKTAAQVIVTKLDVFGVPVGLYYRGEDKYRTTFGACCSVFLAAILIALVVLQALSLNWSSNVPMSQLRMTYDDYPTWNPMFEDGMKLAFAIKGGIEYPREPFNQTQIVPTFVSVSTEAGTSRFQVVPLNPCKSDAFDDIDDISILKRNGFSSDDAVASLLCPDFSNEEEAAEALDLEELGKLNDISGPNGHYMAFLVRGKSVNNTYMDSVRVVGYASSTNVKPDNPERHTFTYMKEVFQSRIIASQPRTMVLKVQKNYAEGFDNQPGLLSIVS